MNSPQSVSAPLQVPTKGKPSTAGTTSQYLPLDIRVFTRRLVLAASVIGSLIVLAGVFYFRSLQTSARIAVHAQLEAIANLKSAQISEWRNERMGDARFLLRTSAVANDVAAFAARPDDPVARARVVGWLEPIKGGPRYESVMIFDPKANLLLAIPSANGPAARVTRESFARVLASQDVVFTDLDRTEGDSAIHLDLLVPIRPPPASSLSSLAENTPVAIIVLRLNPEQFLFPLVQNWPVPSATAESLLVREESDAIVYLNHLRHQAGTALNLRRSTQEQRLPDAQAVHGETGVHEGQDYRGVAVLFTNRRLIGSPWILVTKVDQAEVYATIQRDAWQTGALILLLLVAVALSVGIVWRQRHLAFLRHALGAEKERNALIARLALITQQANDVILLLDEETRIVETNERVMDFYGHTPDQMRQLTARDLRSAEAERTLAMEFERALGPDGTMIETIHRRKDGTLFPVEISARPVAIDGRRHILSIIRDITARKQVELALAHSEAQLRRAEKVAGIGNWEINLATQEVKASANARKIYGIKEGKLTIADITTVPLPEYRARLDTALSDLIKTGRPYDVEFRIQRAPDGQRFDIHSMAEYDPVNRVVFGILHDVTVTKQAEAAVRASEQRYRSILKASPDDITIADLQGRILMASPMAMKMFGYEKEEEFMGHPVTELLVPEDRDRSSARIAGLFQGIAPGTNEYRGLRRDGSIFDLEVNSDLIRDEAGQPTGMVFIARDITERKRTEEVLQTSLREKDALLKEVHHRVKNNLQVITSLLRLEGGRSVQPSTKSVLSDMQSRIRSMAMLHESLYRSGTFAAVDLGSYLKQLVTQSFRTLVTSPTAIQLQLDIDSSVQVELDQALPCGLLVNELISNCLKHGFPDGKSGKVCVDLHPVAGGAQLHLRVSDTGVGLPEDFEAKRQNSLGLQLVFDLARQLDGRLEIGQGPGAVFDLFFTPKRPAPDQAGLPG